MTWVEFIDVLKAISNVLTGILALLAGIVGVFLGSWLTGRRDLRSHTMTSERDRQNRLEEAKITKRQRLEEFDEKNFIEFQEHAADFRYMLNKLKYEVVALSVMKGNEKFYDMNATNLEYVKHHSVLFNLYSRMTDAEIMQLAWNFLEEARLFRKFVVNFVVTRDLAKPFPNGWATDELRRLGDSFKAVSDKIGERIRNTIVEELNLPAFEKPSRDPASDSPVPTNNESISPS